MDYRKTKTMQTGTIDGKGFLSVFLLFFLLVSCDNGRGGTTRAHTSPLSGNPNANHNQTVKTNFMTAVGGWGPCGYNCLLNQVIEDARNNGHTRQSTSGEKTYVIPKKKDGILYFETVATQKIVGDKRKHKWFPMGRTKDAFEIAEGVYGGMAKVVKEFLQEPNTKSAKHPRFFVVAQYMNLSEKIRLTLEKNLNNKEELIAELGAHLKEFEIEISKVKPGQKGIEIIIPTEDNRDAASGGLRFEPLTEEGKTKGKKHKHYTLNKELDKRADEICETIKSEINTLEKNLR